MAPSGDITAHSPPARMPKLKYRNPLPTDQSSRSPQNSPDPGIRASYFDHRPTTADSCDAPSTIFRPSFETDSLTSSSLASTSSSAGSSNGSKSSKKKKKSGSVLGFLSLKEPSQAAFEQFAEQQRKQAAGTGASTPNSKYSNYVGQKLPSNVPKVNSKWDGVPDVIRRRYSTDVASSGSSKDNRSSVSSRGSLGSPLKSTPWNDSKFSVVTDETRNPPNSIASASASTTNLTTREGNLSLPSSPSNNTLPEISYYFPDGPTASGALPVEQSETIVSHDKIAGPPPQLPDSNEEFQQSRENEPVDFRAVSPAPSTDSADTIVRDTADVIFRKLNDRPDQGFWGMEAPAVQSPHDSKPDNVPESHDFLFGPQTDTEHTTDGSSMPSPPVPHYAPTRPVHNFSRPIAANYFTQSAHRSAPSSPYRTTPSNSALPTLYESSLASTESLSTVQAAEEDYDDDDSRSIAPSTIAPSELSKHWYESPRERLGLGGRLRMNDILPWDNQGDARGKPKKNRLSMFGLGAAKA